MTQPDDLVEEPVDSRRSRVPREAGGPLSRRSFVAGTAGALGAAAFGPAFPGSGPRPGQGSGPGGVRFASELGERSPHERPRRIVTRNDAAASSLTPLQDLYGIVTPADLHFERHHSGVPEIDPEAYELLIHGMVERPTLFRLDDLRRYPPRTRIRFIECAGNGLFGYRDGEPTMSPQVVAGLTSTSEWTGVPLSLLFREVGVRPEAKWFLAEGGDPGRYARSIPLQKARDDAMIAYAQNGEAIRPEQGYPARLLLPGFEGSANVKWIRRIELSDAPFMTRAETGEYTDPLGNGMARIFSLVMDASSIITFPAYPVTLPETGWWEITGIAWSGRGRIRRVDVSTDGGASWNPAELDGPVLPRCHTRFRYVWNWKGNSHLLMSRARDETGYVQPTREALLAVRGAGTRYHWNNIRGWEVRGDGSVVFAGGGG